MQEFATLLDTLSYTGSTLSKRKLMADYFSSRPDPERGYALAALTGELSFPIAKPNLIRELAASRVDATLLNMSRDYVGDMAETVSLIWPERAGEAHTPTLEEVIDTLSGPNRTKLRDALEHWLDGLNANSRWALLKLITGNIRIGVSARLAKTALADAYGKPVDEIEQIWHGIKPPYISVFDWLEGRTDKPERLRIAYFLPMMLSHPMEDKEFEAIDLNDFQIELKWDGIRVQLVRSFDTVALYSRTGDDISHTFPDIVGAALAVPEDEFVLDGELLTTAINNDIKDIAPFNDLQQRLNRKTVTPKMLEQFPAHIRLYDMLVDNAEDIRALPLTERRQKLDQWFAKHSPERMDLSPVLEDTSRAALFDIWHNARHEPQSGIEGLMLKKKDSPYIAGRPRGYWFKRKRDTMKLDCVLMYAQRGSGKRSSFYSDYTFGVWEADQLVPVGKAYSGFTDAELNKLDKWIRANTTARFGPVREVTPSLVFEIEFDSITKSARHKSGLAMRFPRVHRIRWDKPAAEADTLENAQKIAT